MLPEWRSPDAPIYALFPSASRLPLKTRVLLDALSRRLRPELMGAD
jgi:hypothetical protein